MIEPRLQIIVAVFLCLVLLTLIRRIVKKILDIKYTLPWMVLIVVLLFVDIFPQLLVWIASIMGIQLPSNMIFLLAIIFLGVIVLYHTMIISKLNEMNKTLVQEVAMLKQKVDELKKQESE